MGTSLKHYVVAFEMQCSLVSVFAQYIYYGKRFFDWELYT